MLMKNLSSTLIIFLFLLFVACDNKGITPEDSAVSAEEFVRLVGDGQQLENPSLLPLFKAEDIPTLLESSNNFKEIPSFPVNPFSSAIISPKYLGECLLWTIEAIRLTPDTSSWIVYPSLNSCLLKEKVEDGEIVYQRLSLTELEEAYQLYHQWWYQNQDIPFEDLREIDPLEGSGFFWKK